MEAARRQHVPALQTLDAVMKRVMPFLTIMAVLPATAHAQIELVWSGDRPVLRANVAGVTISAGLDARGGLDVRLDEGITTRSTTTTRRTTRTARATADAVLNTADAYVGTKYVWGGTTPRGFDCSGFVQYVFRQHGIQLPRTSRQQAAVGQAIGRNRAALEVGDLMFFATNGTRIDHIAIYAGDNQIIHSSSSGGGVGYDHFTSKRGQWFLSYHVASRRVLADGQSLVGPLTAALRALVALDPPDHAPRRSP
jgi:cell wall-associated NlpC family hydrolase